MYMLIEPVVGYTRIVSATKLILSIIALILIALLIIIPFRNSVKNDYKITFNKVDTNTETGLPTMHNPTFRGVDSQGQNYTISAKLATNDKNKTIVLNNLTADLNLKNEDWAAISADDGIYKPEENTLDLKSNVHLFTKDGYEFMTDSVFFELKDGKATGNSPVSGQGTIGTIEADSFLAEEKGDYILLKGNVKVIIYPAASKKAN